MDEKLILKNNEDESNLINLLLLRSAAQWLEKQNWISSPYGGENYLEDFIFRIKLLSGNEWNALFKDGQFHSEDPLMKEYFELLKTIDPNIRIFCDGVLRGSSFQQKAADHMKSKSPLENQEV